MRAEALQYSLTLYIYLGSRVRIRSTISRLQNSQGPSGQVLMSITDKILNCCDCSSSFVFSAGEQEFFQAKGLVNEPKRCPNCRILLRAQRSGKAPESTTQVCCEDCGVSTRVPFQPKGYRPVYCGPCLRAKREPAVAAVETCAI